MNRKVTYESQDSKLYQQSPSEMTVGSVKLPTKNTRVMNGEVSILEIFDDERYAKLAYENHQVYSQNKPYPHIVLDDFLPDQTAELI